LEDQKMDVIKMVKERGYGMRIARWSRRMDRLNEPILLVWACVWENY